VTEVVVEPQFRPVPETTCQQSLDRWDWAATSTFTVGSWELGLRSSTLQMDEALRTLLRPQLRPELDAPPNYSLFHAPSAARGEMQRLHELFQGCGTRWRTRSAAELVRTLLLELEGDRLTEQDDVLAVSAVVLVVDGAAVLIPTSFRQPFVDAGRRLAAGGALLWPAAMVGLDPVTGEVVLPAPSLEVEPDGWRLLEALDDAPERELPEPGRYPVRSWLAPKWRNSEGAVTRAQALLGAFYAVANRDLMGPARTLSGLAGVVSSSEVRPLLLEGDVAEAVLAATGAGGDGLADT
jgi:hypothetical protein